LPLHAGAFRRLQGLFHDASGIKLADTKRSLVSARLRKRVQALRLGSFEAYCEYIEAPGNEPEKALAVDLLTTNETFFFREPAHFELLGRELQRREGERLRIWSAACSTGEEPYSIAMTLLARRPTSSFQLLASDLSQRVLERASRGIYAMTRLQHLPREYLRTYCQQGKDKYEGMMRVVPAVRKSVQFSQHNLMSSAEHLGQFDFIFLRNVLIYFDRAGKQRIVDQVSQRLRPGGWLFIGQAEVLPDVKLHMKRVERAVYER
jgi:chemotaxis protein methyltransferase CheR